VKNTFAVNGTFRVCSNAFCLLFYVWQYSVSFGSQRRNGSTAS